MLVAGAAVSIAAFVVARVPLQEVDAATAAALRAPLPSVPSELTVATSVTLPISASTDPSEVSAAIGAPIATTGTATVDTATVAVTTAVPRSQRLLVVGDSVVYGLRHQFVVLGSNRNIDVAVRAAARVHHEFAPDDQNNLFSLSYVPRFVIGCETISTGSNPIVSLPFSVVLGILSAGRGSSSTPVLLRGRPRWPKPAINIWRT